MSQSCSSECDLTRPQVQSPLQNLPTQQLATLSSRSGINHVPAWKRVLDISCIILASPILVPLCLLIALIIKFVSRGPVIFKQERIGFRGRRFRCLKFRTMRVNPDAQVHQNHLTHLMRTNSPMRKLDESGDPRLIPCGLILRVLGLDELPQLFNVLRGEMSLVGPRPCLPYEYDHYGPEHRRRSETLPGLTGFWQVNGKNRTSFEEMIDLDVYYVDNRSVRLDLWILAKTVPAILDQISDLRRSKRAEYKPGLAEGQPAQKPIH